jgi:hypothetical protein
MRDYKETHIHDIVIDNESSGCHGLDITVKVSSDRECIIHLGNSMTIRTSWQGLCELREVLHEADTKICEMYEEEKKITADESTEEYDVNLLGDDEIEGVPC